jgi:glycosyltransferase 2 family protein
LIELNSAFPLKKKHLFTLLKIVVSGGLITWLLIKIGIDRIVAEIAGANLWWICASIGAFVLSNFIGSYQWYLLLRNKDLDLSFTKVLSFYHVGLFFNNFLIGYVGGDAFRIYDVTKATNDSTNAISTVFFDRFIGFFTLSFLAMMVSLIWLQNAASLTTIYTILIIMMGFVVSLLFLFKESMAKRVSVLLGKLLPTVVNSKLRELYIELNQFRHNKIFLLHLFVIALVVQGLRVVTHVLAARSVGVETNISYFFVFIPIIAMAASLPISFGGIGVREQSGATLFAQIGVAANLVVIFEFIAYLVGVFASIPGGVIFILRKGEAKSELTKVREIVRSS